MPGNAGDVLGARSVGVERHVCSSFSQLEKAVHTRKTKESVEGMFALSLRPILALSRESAQPICRGLSAELDSLYIFPRDVCRAPVVENQHTSIVLADVSGVLESQDLTAH